MSRYAAVLLLIISVICLPQAAVASSLTAWGNDSYNQVSSTPSMGGFAAIASGGSHSLALQADGSIQAWGNNNYGQRNIPGGTGYKAIAAGGNHSMALLDHGGVYVWGYDGYGQVSNRPGGPGFTAIASGFNFCLALDANGVIVVWGDDGDNQVTDTPAGGGFVAIAAGYWHGLAIRADGSIAAWGSDDFNQVSDTPTGTDFVAISGGAFHSVALRSDGSIAAWGDDGYGQVSSAPSGNGFTAVEAADKYTLVLDADGAIVAWGRDDSNQVSGVPSGTGYTAIAPGKSHGLAMQGNPAYILTLISGIGNDWNDEGTEVPIQADAAPGGMIFAWWEGDTATVANIYDANTTMVMPANNATITATYGSPVMLSVGGGTGSGTYVEGSVVSIQANPNFGNQVFKEWIGDIATLADANSAITTVTIPDHYIQVEATYETGVYLNVTDGSGSGFYLTGTEVVITADPPPTGMVFDRWMGGITYVADIFSSTTTVTMDTDIGVMVMYMPAPIAGDLDDDGKCDIVDLNMVLIDWGKSMPNLIDPRSDADGSGTVDIVDLNTVLIDWGK